jgi:plasmid stabilization system protein ParE
MGCPVILTPQSQDDLREIVRFISQDSAERARAFGNALIDKALTLESFPAMGRIVPELGDPSVREIIHGSYRIIYEFYQSSGIVYVLRFWHAARGEPKINEG